MDHVAYFRWGVVLVVVAEIQSMFSVIDKFSVDAQQLLVPWQVTSGAAFCRSPVADDAVDLPVMFIHYTSA